jgi:DNA-directed RNA polymerase specialized sigma24 family protein
VGVLSAGPVANTSLLELYRDDELVALFRSGDDRAFRVIHDRYRRRLNAYARRMLGDPEDAEDAIQDVFVRAFTGLRANNRNLALKAWLYRVAHNRCIDELRRSTLAPAARAGRSR